MPSTKSDALNACEPNPVGEQQVVECAVDRLEKCSPLTTRDTDSGAIMQKPSRHVSEGFAACHFDTSYCSTKVHQRCLCRAL